MTVSKSIENITLFGSSDPKKPLESQQAAPPDTFPRRSGSQGQHQNEHHGAQVGLPDAQGEDRDPRDEGPPEPQAAAASAWRRGVSWRFVAFTKRCCPGMAGFIPKVQG